MTTVRGQSVRIRKFFVRLESTTDSVGLADFTADDGVLVLTLDPSPKESNTVSYEPLRDTLGNDVDIPLDFFSTLSLTVPIRDPAATKKVPEMQNLWLMSGMVGYLVKDSVTSNPTIDQVGDVPLMKDASSPDANTVWEAAAPGDTIHANDTATGITYVSSVRAREVKGATVPATFATAPSTGVRSATVWFELDGDWYEMKHCLAECSFGINVDGLLEATFNLSGEYSKPIPANKLTYEDSGTKQSPMLTAEGGSRLPLPYVITSDQTDVLLKGAGNISSQFQVLSSMQITCNNELTRQRYIGTTSRHTMDDRKPTISMTVRSTAIDGSMDPIKSIFDLKDSVDPKDLLSTTIRVGGSTAPNLTIHVPRIQVTGVSVGANNNTQEYTIQGKVIRGTDPDLRLFYAYAPAS